MKFRTNRQRKAVMAKMRRERSFPYIIIGHLEEDPNQGMSKMLVATSKDDAIQKAEKRQPSVKWIVAERYTKKRKKE